MIQQKYCNYNKAYQALRDHEAKHREDMQLWQAVQRIQPMNPIFPLLDFLFNLSKTRIQQSKGEKQNDITTDFTIRTS
jgi:hypothetical protein